MELSKSGRFIGLVGLMLLLTACMQRQEPWDEDTGMTTVLIPLPEQERYILPMDEPPKEQVNYYEAVLREHGTDRYYTGSSQVGESYLRVPVLPGKRYDALVLAGANLSGSSNGVKVLLASGYEDNNGTGYPVPRGQTVTITVNMSLHKTKDRFWEQQGAFIYKPKIHGIKSLFAAHKPGEPFVTGAQAYVIPHPDPLAYTQLSPPIDEMTADPADGTLELHISGIRLQDLEEAEFYNCYFNLTYYGFGDPNSRSSAWNIRRGITNTIDRPMGGGVLLRYGITYYVHKDGLDTNNGLAKTAPFRTLAKAVSAIRNPANPYAMGTIMVLGKLDNASENGTDTGKPAGFSRGDSVFVIPDGPSGSGGTVIKIAGETDGGGVPPALEGGGQSMMNIRQSRN